MKSTDVKILITFLALIIIVSIVLVQAQASGEEVTIPVRIEGKGETIWKGNVTFSNSTIFTCNTEENYTIDYPSALGALDEASKKGGFSYRVRQDSSGLGGLYVESVADESGSGEFGWIVLVNNVFIPVSAAEWKLNDGDYVLWSWGALGYKPLKISSDKTSIDVEEEITISVEELEKSGGEWIPAENATVYIDSSSYTTDANGTVIFSLSKAGSYKVYAEKEDYIRSEKILLSVREAPAAYQGDGGGGYAPKPEPINVSVRIEGINETIWTGNVTFSNSTIFTAQEEIYLREPTVLGALKEASDKGEFNYTLTKRRGRLIVDSINEEGIKEGYNWFYMMNYETKSIDVDKFVLSEGNEIIWYIGKEEQKPLRISLDKNNVTPGEKFTIIVESLDNQWVEESAEVHINNVGTINMDGELNISLQNPRSYTIFADKEGFIRSERKKITITPIIALNTKIKTIEGMETIELIGAGENASVTFEKVNITRVIINANNTIRNATITIQQIEKLTNTTNVSGMSYCYFNITTTNLTATNITNATIEFRVNKTWLNESNIDETTITLNRYSDINNNWSALPTSKIEEDNASLYFESETQGFSLFAVSGEEKTALPPAALTPSPALTPKPTHPPATTPTPASTPSASIPRIEWIIITAVVVASLLIALVAYLTLRVRKE
jgi:PGF-pre-PGF domain-containing protein